MSSPACAVSVVIPNWNGAHHLPECLQSLRSQTLKPARVLVVDNGSTDDSLALLAREFDWVEVIERGDNGGFSTAVNAGIEASDTPFIALLNNDTRAAPDWLERLVEGLEHTPEASFAASLMLRYDPPHEIDSAGDGFSLLAGAGYNIAAGEPADARTEPAWVFGACAGAALYRRELFADIGLFDEDFFLVFEDVDLDLRAQVAGHRCLYLPDAVVYHKRGASTDNASLEVISRSWRNTIWVAGKNLPGPLFSFWLLAFGLRMARLFGWAVIMRLFRKLFPGSQALARQGPAAPSWRQGVIAGWYWPALRTAFSRLPAKRRATRPLRRLGSLKLLAILLRPSQTVSQQPSEP